jgi:hypothetical protein
MALDSPMTDRPAREILADQGPAEFRCADCGYGSVVRRLPPDACPMCRSGTWQQLPIAPLVLLKSRAAFVP